MRFFAGEPFTFSNGAIGWRPGGPFDCLGPYAKVQNCPLTYLEWKPYPGRENDKPGSVGCGMYETIDSGIRLTCYATGYADTFFSVPAATKYRGKYVGGFFTLENGAIEFHVYTRFVSRIR